MTPVDHEVEMPGKHRERRVYPINLLKRWCSTSTTEQKAALMVRTTVDSCCPHLPEGIQDTILAERGGAAGAGEDAAGRHDPTFNKPLGISNCTCREEEWKPEKRCTTQLRNLKNE